METNDERQVENCAGDDMAEKMRAFRALSQELRKETRGRPHTPSHVLIREDRDSGHRDG